MTWRHGKSVVVWRGPSAFDGSPIVAIVTGLRKWRPSLNPKTGPMAQLWVIRSDMHPQSAVESRGDYAVCGDCKLRGSYEARGRDRACYVVIRHVPVAIYYALLRGLYPEVDPGVVGARLKDLGRAIRLGAYGEVTAMPPWVVADLTANGVGWTGYTHQWRSKPAFRKWLMASVDSEEEQEAARWLGWRTFRIRRPGDVVDAQEVKCPASAEQGHRTTCARCRLCNGTAGYGAMGGVAGRGWDVTIEAHGQGAGNFIRMEEVRRGTSQADQ